MISILDIGPQTEQVSVGGGQKITVHPVTPEGLFVLISAFPELAKIKDAKAVNASTIMATVPAAVAMAIAIATTDRESYPDFNSWKEYIIKVSEAVHKRVVPPAQLAIISAAIRLTFPDGVGPFVKDLNSLKASFQEVSGQVSDTTLSKSSRSGFETDSVGMRLGRIARTANSAH